MSKEREAIRQQIAALEEELNGREPARQAQEKTAEEEILSALQGLETLVKEACGESFMDMSYTDDDMSYMDDDMNDGMEVEEIVLATEEAPVTPGADDDISQDYLDDVLQEEKSPASIVTDTSMLDAAPTGYTARLKSASERLDKVAEYLEQQGREQLALQIDKISDAIDARINKEARDV